MRLNELIVMRDLAVSFLILIVFGSCAVSKAYNPSKKFSPAQLREDYTVFKGSLEESHPGLYWYTPKDSMDYYVDIGSNKLTDSLTKGQF